jgi:DNA polymerase III alpha subunit (gram-positive type)
MLIAFFDFETTGLDLNQDRPTEYGALLYTTSFNRVVMAEQFLVESDIPVTPKITELTKINKPMIGKFGLESADALSRLQNYFDMADSIAGKNIFRFDMPMYRNWCLREKEEPVEKLLIDIETDLPGVECKHLGYMAADAGFLNPFPHAALPDAWTSLRLFQESVEKVGLDKIVERAKSPRVYLKAHVSFDKNRLAKDRKYSWHSDRKVWYKIVKEMDVELEGKEAPFDISRIEPVPQN